MILAGLGRPVAVEIFQKNRRTSCGGWRLSGVVVDNRVDFLVRIQITRRRRYQQCSVNEFIVFARVAGY